MDYLLDTCSISEMVAVKPNPNVSQWFRKQPGNGLYLSIITVGEIQKGIYQLAVGKRRSQLEAWLFEELLPSFRGRTIDIDGRLISTWAKMVAEFKTKGMTRASFDSLIEATALHHNLVLVTRNVRNFQGSNVSILNIWEK